MVSSLHMARIHLKKPPTFGTSTDYDIPIVFTGAMRSSNEIGSDGVYNLMSAVRVAANDEAHGKGVLVVLNDEIHTATNVTKTHPAVFQLSKVRNMDRSAS